MFVSVRRYTHLDDTRSLVRDIQLEFVPKLQRMPGFIAYYVIETDGGVVNTISVFSTAELAEESNGVASRWLHQRAGGRIDPSETLSGRVSVAVPPIRG
jgi:hypothetical protein